MGLIRPIQTEDVQELDALLREEGHPMVSPTHVIENSGRITGALSVDSIIPVTIFLSKKDTNKLDMLSIMRFTSSYCDSISNNNVIVQIGPESPGYKIMQRMGAKYIGLGHYWHYEITT